MKTREYIVSNNRITHLAFSDESYYSSTDTSYRSICMVSFNANDLEFLRDKIQAILNEYSIKEFKWVRMKYNNSRLASTKLIEFAIESALANKLRIDTIIWDIEDSRHKIDNRDDKKNFAIMYYHLLKNVLIMRWGNDAIWGLYPDDQKSIDWEEIEAILDHTSVGFKRERSLLDNENGFSQLQTYFRIACIKEESSSNPFIQLADLFSGLSVFSMKNYESYCDWERSTAKQTSFLAPENEKFTKIEKQRYLLIKEFNKLAKMNKLGISLKTYKGFRTIDPKYPINFWLYVPQTEFDKAPEKEI